MFEYETHEALCYVEKAAITRRSNCILGRADTPISYLMFSKCLVRMFSLFMVSCNKRKVMYRSRKLACIWTGRFVQRARCEAANVLFADGYTSRSLANGNLPRTPIKIKGLGLSTCQVQVCLSTVNVLNWCFCLTAMLKSCHQLLTSTNLNMEYF